MSLIVGFDDFGQVVTEKFGFVDKSLFIKEIFDNSLIEASVQEALAQIQERNYESELQQKGIQKILKVGLAFRGKEVALASS